jgi:hypothetical protein
MILVSASSVCVYQKPAPGRSGDEIRLLAATGAPRPDTSGHQIDNVTLTDLVNAAPAPQNVSF